MALVITTIVLVLWFGIGYAYAPMAAARAYDNSAYTYEDNKRNSAKCGYWFSISLGPAYISLILMRALLLNVDRRGQSRVDRGLLTHSLEAQRKYSEELELKILALDKENTRRNSEILGV